MARRRGFTLVELLVVVLVIGILASVAVPSYMRAMEQARQGEAKQVLGMLFRAQKTYYAMYGSYVFNADDLDLLAVDVPPNDSLDHYFTYLMVGDANQKLTLYAYRKVGNEVGKSPNAVRLYQIMCDEKGNFTLFYPDAI